MNDSDSRRIEWQLGRRIVCGGLRWVGREGRDGIVVWGGGVGEGIGEGIGEVGGRCKRYLFLFFFFHLGVRGKKRGRIGLESDLLSSFSPSRLFHSTGICSPGFVFYYHSDYLPTRSARLALKQVLSFYCFLPVQGFDDGHMIFSGQMIQNDDAAAEYSTKLV